MMAWVAVHSCSLGAFLPRTMEKTTKRECVQKYREIAQDVALRISTGEFASGSVLPSEQALAAHYAVARGTLRHALGHLAQRGLLAPRQGAGWAVYSSLQTHSFSELRSFAQWAASKGFTAGGRVTRSEAVPATARTAAALRVPLGQTVLRVTRVRTLDGRTVMLERTNYPQRLAAKIASIPADEPSVVGAMQQCFGIVPVHAEHTIDAVAASSDDAAALGIRRSSPLLRVRRVSFARDGKAIECGDDRYVAGEMAFQMAASATNTTFGRTLE